MLKLINIRHTKSVMNSLNTWNRNTLQSCSLKYELLIWTVCTTAIVRFSKSDFCLASGILSVRNYLHFQDFSDVMCFRQIFRMIGMPSVPWTKLSSNPVQELVMNMVYIWTQGLQWKQPSSCRLFVCKHYKYIIEFFFIVIVILMCQKLQLYRCYISILLSQLFLM
jgi:hypothetical protein